ncbi:MAG TPA: sulfite reductase subunit alpha [Burkholderiales bacterium]|nr:sulfite reductase subunit alpha [Burkholderiales bacterium]
MGDVTDPLQLIPGTAPFSPAQRAWLSGFFAGMMAEEAQAAATPAAAPAAGPEEDFPWHEPTLALGERMKLAEGRPFERKLMAAMGQLDCGQCGYLCKTYAEAIAEGTERDVNRCVPGGKATAKKLKEMLADKPVVAVVRAKRAPAQAAKAEDDPAGYSRDRPVLARLLRSEPLNAPSAEKQTQNVVLSLAGTGVEYAPGDSLGVWASNYGEEVELLLSILRAKGSEPVTLASGERVSAREALLKRCNLREAGEDLYRLLSEHAKNDTEAAQLACLADGEADSEKNGVHDVFDLLVKFRSARPPLAEFVAALSSLQPRLYSIASSQRCHPGEVHLTVAVVDYELDRRGYLGVASNFFAERLRLGRRVPAYVQRAHNFSLPDDPAAPIVMVGPGTGVAPFRAFLQERAASRAPGKNWLFFGNQHRSCDFLYRGELEGYLKRGVLARLDTAFSRDQAGKIYVQHRMRENAAELWRWMTAGACIYVCGDAKKMAADVDAALAGIVAEQGGMDMSAAKKYLADLAKSGRYQRDVY